MASVEKSSHVVVGCKLPNGLVLRTFSFVEMEEMGLGGVVRKFKQAVQDDKIVTVHGCAVNRDGEPPEYSIVKGTALTQGVPSDVWRKFAEQNKASLFMEKDLLWAEPDDASARAHAQNNRSERSGLEPMKTEADPRAAGLKVQSGRDASGRLREDA